MNGHKLDTNIDVFLKKYEIKKKLMSKYDTNFYEKNQDYKNLKNYLKILGLLMESSTIRMMLIKQLGIDTKRAQILLRLQLQEEF